MAHPRYRLFDGSLVKSVTTILGMYGEKEGLLHWANALGLEGKSHRDERDRAANVGTVAHAMVEAHAMGQEPRTFTPKELDCEGDPERYQKIFEYAGRAFLAYLEWRDMTRIEIIAAEVSMVSEKFRFGGTLDAVGVAGSLSQLCLIDWKTSSRLHHTYIAQVAGYCHLWRHGHLLDSKEVAPPRFNEPIESAHILRFDKKHGTFTHAHLTRDVIAHGWKLFDSVRQAVDVDHELKGAI